MHPFCESVTSGEYYRRYCVGFIHETNSGKVEGQDEDQVSVRNPANDIVLFVRESFKHIGNMN